MTRLNPLHHEVESPTAARNLASILPVNLATLFWTHGRSADGKIIVGGYNDINHQIRPMLARLNPNGSPDKNFQISDMAGKCIWSIIVQPDGKIIAGGDIKSVGGAACGNIVRLQN